PAAIAEFQTALAEHPERVGALQGLAIAQYKTGALADAAAKLDQVLDQAPQNGTALLYGGLVALQQKQDELAAERLARFRALEPDPRFGPQVDRAPLPDRRPSPPGAAALPAQPGRAAIPREPARNGPPHPPALGTPQRSQGAPRLPASRPEMAPHTPQRSERPGERVALLDPALL